MNEETLCFNEDTLIGNYKNLLTWAQEQWKYEDFRSNILYAAIAEEAYKNYYLQNPVKSFVDALHFFL